MNLGPGIAKAFGTVISRVSALGVGCGILALPISFASMYAGRKILAYSHKDATHSEAADWQKKVAKILGYALLTLGALIGVSSAILTGGSSFLLVACGSGLLLDKIAITAGIALTKTMIDISMISIIVFAGTAAWASSSLILQSVVDYVAPHPCT